MKSARLSLFTSSTMRRIIQCRIRKLWSSMLVSDATRLLRRFVRSKESLDSTKEEETKALRLPLRSLRRGPKNRNRSLPLRPWLQQRLLLWTLSPLLMLGKSILVPTDAEAIVEAERNAETGAPVAAEAETADNVEERLNMTVTISNRSRSSLVRRM